MSYTKPEKLQIIKWSYGGNSIHDIVQLFPAAFENRPVPNPSTISRIIKAFEEKGCVLGCKCHKQNAERQPNEEHERRDTMICAIAENEPTKSTRQIALEIGTNKETVRKVLKKNGYKSFKLSLSQQIFPHDHERRMLFCERMMEMANENFDFLSLVCFSDESTFPLLGKPNSSVVRYWSTINPRKRLDYRTQYPQKLNVWAGMCGDHVIGPFFIDGNLTGNRYLALLQNQIVPTLRRLLGDNFNRTWFQQDGCPAHGTAAVSNFLENTFPNRLISRQGNIAWPARSPDLAPNDFFFWGFIKQKVYDHRRAENLEELRQKVQWAFECVTREMLINMRRGFYNRLGYCLAVEGDLFEHLL